MLFIKRDANYHDHYMMRNANRYIDAYLNSMHFSEKFSYKILFISSYGSKDMHLPRFAYLQEF
jgi:hypothetical protein